MGRASTMDMLEVNKDLGLVSKRSILEWHIMSNHYPTPPFSVVDIAESAIKYALEGDYEHIIKFGDFDKKFKNRQMSVRNIIKGLHLEDFLENEEECE